MYFDIYGPFEIVRVDGEITSRQPEMWSAVRERSVYFDYGSNQLEQAIGCYVFALKHGESIKPWYVGMTVAKKGFRGEVFQNHKLYHYNEVVRCRRGSPLLFLMPLLTPEGYFGQNRRSNKRLIEWVEKMLFGIPIRRNPQCRNQRDTKYLRNVVVHGLFNSRPPGRQGPEVAAVRAMFGDA